MPITVTRSRPKALNRRSVYKTWTSGGVLQNNSDSTTLLHSGLTVDYWNRTSDNTPGYYAKVRSGAVLPDQNLGLTTYRRDPGLLTYGQDQRWSSGGPRTFEQVWEPSEYWANQAHAGGNITSRAQLVARVLEKQRGNEWNVPVFLAEGRTTMDMVSNRAHHLVSLVRALRRGDANRFLDGLRSASEGSGRRRRTVSNFNRDFGRNPREAAGNMWLENTYGWTPFMMDVHNAMDTLMDLAEERQEALVGRTRARVRSTVNPRGVQSANSYFDWDERMTTYTEERRMVWRWRPKAGSVPARLGLTNPVVVAWELLPFSFVADWFLPIGDYFSQLDTPFRVDHLGGSEGFRQHTKWVRAARPKPPLTASFTTFFAAGLANSEVVSLQRTPLTGIPSLGLGDIVLDPQLGARRLLSGIALLQQNLRWFGRNRNSSI